jgi:hypothetical protein
VFHQGCRKRAVGAFAVACHRASLGCKGHQRVRHRRFDLGKAAADRTAGKRPLHGVGEWIVAAGVKDHEPQPLRSLERLQHPVERNRFILDVEVADELCIGGHQIVDAVDLDAVTGIVDDRDIGVARGLGKFANDAAQVGDADVALVVDRVKTGLLEQGGYHFGVARRIGQPWHLLILGHADDKRDALFGSRRPRRKTEQTSDQNEYGSHPTPRDPNGLYLPIRSRPTSREVTILPHSLQGATDK